MNLAIVKLVKTNNVAKNPTCTEENRCFYEKRLENKLLLLLIALEFFYCFSLVGAAGPFKDTSIHITRYTKFVDKETIYGQSRETMAGYKNQLG